MRFTVHRPPYGEVSLCWHRPPGGDVACSIHVGVTRPRLAGDAREYRLVLAVFGRDVPTDGTSLRRVCNRDPFNSARSLVVEPDHQLAPPLIPDRAVEAPFLSNPNARLPNSAAPGAGHRPYIQVLYPNGVEPTRQIGCGLFHPVSAPVRFAGFELRDRQLGALPAVRAALATCEALLQAAQPDPLTRCKAGCVQQFAGGQCRRHRHAPINTDHAAIPRTRDRVGDLHKGDMPATGPIPNNPVGLHTLRQGSRPAESNPPHLGHPHPPITLIELLHMARLDLPKAFMHARLAKRRAPMGARKEVPHSLGEVPQRLLLHRLRPGRQPVIFGAGLGQLRALLVVRRSTTARLPQLLLLHSQIPHKPGMLAMLHQPHLLSRRRQQPKPRHTRNLATTTDNKWNARPVGRYRSYFPTCCRRFQPKEV